MPRPSSPGPRRLVRSAPKRPVQVPTPGGEDDPGPLPPASITSYASALRFLNQRTNVERLSPSRLAPGTFTLDRMRDLLAALGHPERDVRCVHVAGSKGKGSVVEMTASCLSACGYTVGVYTSPHLVDLRERVRIGRDLIAPGDFYKLLQRVASAAAPCEQTHGPATFFELLTALALEHFREKAVDIAVVEVGLGGRLDSTNLVQPEVSAITAIQLEHTQILGDTLAKIAREKAGIMKPGVPVLTIPQPEEVMGVFREQAGAAGASLRVVGQDVEFSYRFEADHEHGPHARVCLSSPRSNYEHLAVPLKGEHQALNCGLALGILDALRDRGFDAPERRVAEGLAATPIHGRMEMLPLPPARLIVDGAHNPESVRALVRSIGAHLRYDSMVVIFGCAADKNIDAMLAEIARGADKIIFTRASDNARAANPRDLLRRFSEVSGKMAQAARSLPEALDIARRAVGRGDLVCVTGSFYLAGEAKRLATQPNEPARRGDTRAPAPER